MNRFGQTIALLLTSCTLAALPAAAARHHERPKAQEQQADKPQPELPANPRDLVHDAIENQLKNTERTQFSAWKEKDIKPKGTTVKQMVETPQGVISRILEKNGRPLTPQEQQAEDARVNRLLDPDQMKEKAKSQKEDEDRTVKMLRAIPDAFFFQYAGTTTAPNGDRLAHITFTPNPDFDPPTRESLVFEGMKGDMIVDVNQLQIAKIDGTLFKDVNIGWGIIGHLDHGGRFMVEQAEVYKGHWDQTKMILDFTGKALFFKTIRIKEDSTAWDFQPVPNLDVRAALQFLKDKEMAAGSSATEASR